MAFCVMCGAPLADGAKYCEHCGAPVAASTTAPAPPPAPAPAMASTPAPAPAPTMAYMPAPASPPAPKVSPAREPSTSPAPDSSGTQVTKNIVLCPDGVYRWSYEMDMLRNPTIMLSTLKAMGLAIGIVIVFMVVMDLIEGNFDGPDRLVFLGQLFGIMAGIFLVLGIIAYLIVAALYGWKYQCLFEMTEEQVTHIQMPKQFKKAEAIGWLTTVVGLAAGKPSMVGLGLNSAARSSTTSTFANVATVKVRRWRHTIHVNHLLDKNQVYAEDEDFDFVEQFIKARCTKAKIS